MEPLIDGYLRWLSSTTAITIPTTPPPSIDESAHYLYTVFIFNIFLGLRSVTLSRRSDSLSLTLDFIAQGILVKTPTSPNVGIAIKTLELFYRIQLQKPSMSAEAFAKILCDYHKVRFITAIGYMFSIHSHIDPVLLLSLLHCVKHIRAFSAHSPAGRSVHP